VLRARLAREHGDQPPRVAVEGPLVAAQQQRELVAVGIPVGDLEAVHQMIGGGDQHVTRA